MMQRADTESAIELGEKTPLFSSNTVKNKTQIISDGKKPFSGNAVKTILIGLVMLSGIYLWLPTPSATPSYTEADTTEVASSSPPLPTVFAPLSTVDPRSLNFTGVTRPSSTPGPAFGNLRKQNLPLPTNSWSQNLL